MTPFDDRDRLDVETLTAHVDFLATAGVNGLMPARASGEDPLLEAGEAGEFVEAAEDLVR